MIIEKIEASEILDSRGIPTVGVRIFLKGGGFFSASVPSGTSAGKHEAWELRDHDTRRYSGNGVRKAVENIKNKIAPKLIGIQLSDLKKIDEIMLDLDGTQNKSNLGANAILAVSIAALKALSWENKKEIHDYIRSFYGFKGEGMPRSFSVLIEGGKHADSNVDIQEFMIVVDDNEPRENIRKIVEIYHSLGTLLKSKGKNANVGYEGAYGPDLSSNKEGIELLIAGIEKSGLVPGKDVKICLDVAASEIYDAKKQNYLLKSENISYSSHQMVGYLENLVKDYPIFSIEDGLAEDDFQGWEYLHERLGDKIMLVGDDLFVTNTQRIKKGIKDILANAVLIKPNQIGTVTETLDAIKMTKEAHWTPIISHRSGETNESFIVDIAFGTGAPYCKIGAPARGERIAKYNRLLEIGESKS